MDVMRAVAELAQYKTELVHNSLQVDADRTDEADHELGLRFRRQIDYAIGQVSDCAR
jgi:hypothetical protein